MNFVPSSWLAIFGIITELLVAPDALTMTSRCRACSMVFTALVCHVTQTFISLPMLPIQENFCASNRPTKRSNSGSIAMPLVSAANVRPSRGVLL